MEKTSGVLEQLHNFPVTKALYGREAVDTLLINRPVYYREQPAVVEEFLGQHGKVHLRAVCEEGFTIEPWVSRLAGEKLDGQHKADVDLLSELVWWFQPED